MLYSQLKLSIIMHLKLNFYQIHSLKKIRGVLMNKSCILFLFSLLFLTPFSQVFSQTTGKISGLVTDKTTGEPIPFANIFVEGTTVGAASNIDGNYVIINISPGLYRVIASVVGF